MTGTAIGLTAETFHAETLLLLPEQLMLPSGPVGNHAAVVSGPYNADKWISPAPSPGDLVLFPSYLLHAVPPNEGEWIIRRLAELLEWDRPRWKSEN